MAVIKPPRLRKGDLIGLVSPASTPRPAEKIDGAVRYLEGRGYNVLVGENTLREHGYLAGTDAQRAGDLNAMIRNPRVKAIFALRGGYGCGRILDQIDYASLRRTPKIVSGFSDITGLQLAIFRKCKLVTFSGPMPAVEFWNNPDPYTEENFWPLITSVLSRRLRNPTDAPLRSLRLGKAEGYLLGGNLALVTASLGTKYCPSLRNVILVLEEVDEAPYRVDRMLGQIRYSKALPSALLFGQFTHCEPKKQPSLNIEQIVLDFVERITVPAMSNLQYGHVPRKLTIPFGAFARVNVERQEIRLLESVVS